MEGLTAETCSMDGSRQTNYIQLLPMADGDTLTQPAFGNLTTYVTAIPSMPVTIRMPNERNGGGYRDILPKPITSGYDNTNGSIASQSQLLLYDLGNGQYAIAGTLPSNVMVASEQPTSKNASIGRIVADSINYDVTSSSEIASAVPLFIGVNGPESSTAVPADRVQLAETFDTEAHLEAPLVNRTVGFQIDQAHELSDDVGEELTAIPETSNNGRKKNRHKKNLKSGWPKGKRRRKPHPRLKEPGAPATAYVIYSRERRPLLRIENPDVSNADMTRIIGHEWTTLSKNEKQRYYQKADQDLDRYKKELKEYQQSAEYQAYLREKRQDLLSPSSNDRQEPPAELETAISSIMEPNCLYCNDCDIYFTSEHNKAEHMRSLKHRRQTVGEFQKYLAKQPTDCDCSAAAATAGDKDDLVTIDFATWQRQDPANMDDLIVNFIESYTEIDRERNLELRQLRQYVHVMEGNVAQKKSTVIELKARHDKFEQDIAQTKFNRALYQQQLANLQAIPFLFDTEDFVT